MSYDDVKEIVEAMNEFLKFKRTAINKTSKYLPLNKNELINLVKNVNINLGGIDAINIDDMSEMLATVRVLISR